MCATDVLFFLRVWRIPLSLFQIFHYRYSGHSVGSGCIPDRVSIPCIVVVGVSYNLYSMHHKLVCIFRYFGISFQECHAYCGFYVECIIVLKVKELLSGCFSHSVFCRFSIIAHIPFHGQLTFSGFWVYFMHPGVWSVIHFVQFVQHYRCSLGIFFLCSEKILKEL